MENRDGEVHISTDEVRGGSTPHIVRWILGISLLAAIVLLSALWMTSAALQSDAEDETSVTAAAAERTQGDDTDSTVDDRVDQADDSREAPDTTTPTIGN